jgi:hypothetical protein
MGRGLGTMDSASMGLECPWVYIVEGSTAQGERHEEI